MKKTFITLLLITLLFSCKNETKTNGKLNIVTTTSMITDLVKNIAGDSINIQGLMGMASFTDDEKNVLILRQVGGNVNQAIAILLEEHEQLEK